MAARLGIVASRKVGPAVVRNRCKRLVREAFRLHPEVFPAGIDVVIIVRPGTHLLGREELEGEVKGAAPQLARRARDLGAGAPAPLGRPILAQTCGATQASAHPCSPSS